MSHLSSFRLAAGCSGSGSNRDLRFVLDADAFSLSSVAVVAAATGAEVVEQSFVS
jgi:hypothetical protein